MQKVQALKYGEEACYNGTLIIKAFSSGLDIGACNWTMNSPRGNSAYLSGSVFVSAMAMDFDYPALQGSDMIFYSDFSSWNVSHNVESDNSPSPPTSDISSFSDTDDNWETIAQSLLNNDEASEEMEKLAFVCSCAIDSVKAGGSVLIPIGRIGIILQLLEQISFSLESSNLKVPIYIVSSVAEELLAFSNIIPEWLCKQRQEKLYSGEPLFAHGALIKEKKIHLFPEIHSLKLLKIWQEPCIVFCPHWSLRLGPVIHLLRRWCMDQNSLLVVEEGVDDDLALLPFKPVAMKVLQCSFLSGIRLEKVQPLLKILQPKYVLIPENLRQHVGSPGNTFSLHYYSENDTLRIPNLKDSSELDIVTDLVSQFHWKKLKHQEINVARLNGELFTEQGKHRLLPGNEQVASSLNRQLVHWGTLDLEALSMALQKLGIKGSIEQSMSDATGLENASIVHVFEPNKALIEVKATSTVISTADESLASLICEAICGILDGI
ncbi:unnamed protein product [Ilex paraguariensis]|uniref:Beta-Casp domain-containing protein n=1 Tax=Ilex paraguariensis TaxID=185542 RepID=A0ABC8R5I5_9AQUA